jgi:hypothetical protein
LPYYDFPQLDMAYYTSEACPDAALQEIYMLHQELNMSLTPYSYFDCARYNSFHAQNRYVFPIQGPEQFILDHSMFGKTVETAPAPAPLEYVGYYIEEPVKVKANLGDWVVVERAQEEEEEEEEE